MPHARSRVFMNGNSQAIRIPAAFRLDCQDVEIEKTESGALIIRPILKGRGQQLMDALRDIDADFVVALEEARSHPDPVQERDPL
ncbi:MAG: antitoxin [Burkholderiales bacterium]